MKNQKKLSKTNTQRNSRSGKSTGRRHQSAVTDAKAHNVKAMPSTSKAPVKAKPNQAPRKSAKSTSRRAANAAKTTTAAKQEMASPQVKQLERCRQVKKLHDEGHSLAELALKFECSKSLVRDLVELASLPKNLEEAYVLGKMGRKKVLELARAGRSPNKPQAVVPTEKTTRPEPSSAPMSQEERERRVSDGADLVVEWFRSRELPPCDWEMFWSQVNSGLYGRLPWLFTSEAPRHGEIHPDEDPWVVIKRCRVKSKNPASMADVINDCVKELARWTQRVFPERTMMKEAFTRAESELRRENRAALRF